MVATKSVESQNTKLKVVSRSTKNSFKKTVNYVIVKFLMCEFYSQLYYNIFKVFILICGSIFSPTFSGTLTCVRINYIFVKKIDLPHILTASIPIQKCNLKFICFLFRKMLLLLNTCNWFVCFYTQNHSKTCILQ